MCRARATPPHEHAHVRTWWAFIVVLNEAEPFGLTQAAVWSCSFLPRLDLASALTACMDMMHVSCYIGAKLLTASELRGQDFAHIRLAASWGSSARVVSSVGRLFIICCM